MKLLDSITNDPRQHHRIILDDNSILDLELQWKDNQKGWFYTFSYGDRTIHNRRIVMSVNMLRQFKNIMPFGFLCKTTDGYEIVSVDDFSKGRAQFYILNETDVENIETSIING